MSLHVIKAGLQTTLQGTPYRGHRHLGMPAAGAADCLSLFLANRLVGNDVDELALEVSLSGATFVSETALTVALTGALCDFRINEKLVPQHKSVSIAKGDQISIDPAKRGCRSYLAVSGQFRAEAALGGRSTYQPAALGGFQGRALRDRDILPIRSREGTKFPDRVTPDHFVPSTMDGVILRVTSGPEFSWLDQSATKSLFQKGWKVDQRMSRMGLMLDGKTLGVEKSNTMQSAAAFPGTIQCPPNGRPFLLGPDAQTTGGYPRVAHVIKADRHLIGQLKPGSKIQLVNITPEQATAIYREKLEILKPWLGKVQFW